MYPECGWGKLHFWAMFIGANLTLLPSKHFVVVKGIAASYIDYPCEAIRYWNLGPRSARSSSFASFIFFFGVDVHTLTPWRAQPSLPKPMGMRYAITA